MKTVELREQRGEDLRTRLAEVKEEYFNLRFQNATGQLENYGQLGRAKRDIARIETILRERELDIEAGPETAGQAVEKTAQKASRKWGRRSRGAGEETQGPQPEAEVEEEEEASDE